MTNTRPPARVNRWQILHIVQGRYPAYGWEDLCASEVRADALADLRAYRVNEPGTPTRLIRRRVPNPAYTAPVPVPARVVFVCGACGWERGDATGDGTGDTGDAEESANRAHADARPGCPSSPTAHPNGG